MAEAVTQEVMQKKEGKVGMTTLTFRSKQYTFPSLIVKPDAQPGTVATPDAENICVLLDVGLFCPFCTGTFTAKFVRSHGRLALNKQGNFELTGEQAVGGGMHPGQMVLAPEHSDHACCGQHGNTQPPPQDSDGDMGDFGLRRNVEKEFNESGIHVHITPQAPSEQPKFAKIVPLSSQHSHHHQPQLQQRSHHHHGHSHSHHRHHHNQGPHSARETRHHDHSKQREQDPLVLERQKLMKQNLKQQHRERQMQIRQQQSRYLQSLENNQQRMTQLKAGQVYVEQKSSQYVIKHDLTKKHKRVPPPPPPKHSLKQKSPKPESKQPKLPKEGSPAKVRKQFEQPQYTPEQRKRRGSSVDRQEIIYEGENIAQGGCIETNLDDFSQIVTSREIAGQIRTPPVKPRNLTSRDHSSPEARSPTRIDPYRVIAKRKRKGHVATERQRDENQNVVHRQPEALTIEKPDTKHESLEQLTPTRTSQHAPWASDNDIYRQPLPVNRLAKQTPPKIPPRIRKPEQQLPVPAPRPSQRESSETRSTTSEEGRGSVRSKSSMSEAEQENWIKISKVSRGSRAPEILGPVVEPARNESQEVPKKESSTRRQIRSHTDERIINYIGEQAAIHNFPQEQVHGANIARSPSLSQKDYRGARTSPSTSATQSVGSSSHDHERNELNVTSDSAFNEIRKLSSQEGDESDTASEEADDVFNPEDALDEILESVETETYSPTSTLSRAFTGPRGKKKKKKPIEELQRPLEVPDEEAELHEAVAQIIDNELRTPSPETFLDEILEGVDDGETVTDAQDWDAKHSKTTTASMNTKTTTTYTSELLHQTVVAHGSSETRDSQPHSDSSESPARESLESTLTALNANQSAKPSSPSTSCECLPEDGGDNLSVGKSTYDGTSENSENDEARDSESPGYPVSRKKPGSDTSIEKIIDRTLFLTDKILAAYPEIEQNEQLADRNESTLASVATQSSLSDYEEVPDTEDPQEDVELEDLVSEEVDKAIKEDSRKEDNIDYQFHGAYDELNQYMKRSEGNEASLLKETFDSQLSVKTESDFINADFHSSKAYSPPSPQMSGPVSIDYSGPVAMRDDREHQVSTERATEMDDPRAQGIKLEKVTKDLYDIQHSLASEGETWLIEDFYEDTEFAELESMSSDQGTMEKKRLSRHLAGQAKEEATVDGQRHHPEMSGESDTDAAGVPRKVQFWVPHRERGAETEEEEEELKDLESFEEVEERLREMERTVKEMGALDSLDAPSDLDQEAFSKEDLREVDDDQYNSEHTTEDLDQLESSCNEDIGSEIDDVIEALMMDEQFGDDSAEIIESGTDRYVHEDVKKPSYSHDKKLGPLRYVSPISTSGSESESEVESKDSSSHECDDRVPEVTIANAEAQTLMQDFVKADTKQRSEVCITYVNVDGSSSDSITDPFVDESESESVIFVNKSSIAGSLDSVKLKEVDDEIKEQTRQEILTHTARLVNLELNQEPEQTRQEILTHTTRLVNLEMNQEPEVPNNEVDKRREATKRVITPTVVVDKSSSSESSDESEADSAKDFENIYKSYAESDQVETETSVLPSQYELEEEYLGTHASVPVSDALRRKRQEKKEKESKPVNEEKMEIFNREEEDQIKKSITPDKDSGDLIRWSPDSDEKRIKEDPETKVEKVKGDKTGTSTTVPTSEPQQEGSGTVAASSTTSEKVLAQSTNVATFETEEVLSKKQAQEFLKHMFGANHAGGHKKESEDLEACLSDVCQVVAESNEDYEVKEEEVSTQEITLIFAWPRNNQLPLKRYDEPFREIHLRRVTKIKDFGIEVVEGPTVTTIERPGVPEIEDSPPCEKSSTKLPTSDSIVVSQKRKETVTKRVIPPQETTALPSQSSDVEEKEMKVDKSEDEDDGSSCGRPLSRDVEEDLEELLGGISDVSESFEFGGEKFQHPEHRDASAQTEGLSPDYCTWSDDQSSLLDTDTDCTDEEACFSSTGEGEHSTHAHTGAQGSMSAHTQNLTDSTNQSQPYKTNSNMYRRNASTQTGGGYIASMLPKGFGINAHGSAAQVEFASASGSVAHTLVNKASIISECTSIAAPSDKTNNSQSTSVTSSSRGGTSHSNPTQNLSTSMCVDVLPSFQSSVPCSAGPAYIKPPRGFMKSEGLIGRCLQAREHGNQLLLVAMGDDILEMDQCELADRDPGFSILHMGQCCCARSPFFDRVTLMDQIDTNIYNCADVLELENELVKYSATTIQLVTQGTLECVQPFPLVESAIWTDSLEFGMASPNFEGFIHSSADSFEKACLKHPGDKVDVCAEESTIESECVIPEIIEICANQSISETRDTKAYFAEVAYAGSENLASYEATVSNTVTNYGVAFQTEELAAWMLNMVFLTMFTQRGKHQLEKEVTNIDPRPYNDQKTGIKYARPNCTPTGTSVDCSSAPSGIIPYFAAEVSTVASECMCIVPVSIAVCGSNAMSKPKFNLSLAVDILTCDIHDDGMDQSTGSIVDDSPHVALNDTSSDISVTLQEVDLGVCRKAPDEPQDGQKHPKDTGDGKESGGKKGQKGDSAQGGTSQSTRYSTSGGQSSSFSSGTTGGGASGGSGGGGGDDDPWDRRPKRPHEQDQKRSSKKDKKSDSTDEESDEEDGYGTVVRADVVKGKEKRQGGAYSVEKVVQHISFKPIGMVENKAVEMEVSAPPEIVIPVVRMSAQSDESACKIDRSPVLMTKPPEFKSVSKSTKSTGHESSDVSSDMENFDFQDMVQKMWKPMEPLVPPPHFHPMTGKEETVVKRSMDYEYEHKSSDGTHVREAWSTKDDGGKVPSQGKPQGHLELEDTRRRSTEHAEQIVRPDLPPIVQHKVKLPRTEKKDEQVYASVKQTARMPQYAPRLETEITSSRDANISGDRQHHKKTVTKETFVTSGRQFTAPDPEGILQSFRKRASREDLTDVRKETDSSADGHGRHHTMVEVQSHDTNIPFMDDSSEPSEQVRSNVISDTVTVTREVRGSQGTTDKRLSSSAGEYYHRSASEDNEMNRHDGYDQRSVMRSNSSDGVISGRPPLPPTRRRPSEDDLPDDDPMKLFPILQYLSPKEQEEFMRRVAGNSQEQQINQAPYKPPVPPKPRKAMQMMEQQRVEGRQFEHQYARSAKPIYQAQTSDTSNSFDNIMNCRPIQPIHKIAFCAQEGTEEAPLTNYGSIDVVASYDTMEDESSCYSDTTGYSDEEYISRQSRSAGSMSDARSDHLSGTDDGILKIYHDGQLVAQIRNERAQQTTRVNLTGSAPAGEKWLYSFPGQGAQGEQRHQDGTLASIDKRTLQTIPRLEKVSPVVKHESSKAFIDDSVPGQFSEEHYNSKVIQQDLGDQGQLTGMHASSFTHTKTGSWEENQNQGGLSMRLQGVQREKTREEVHSTKSRQVNTLQDKYEDVVENLKQRILGFGRQQKSVQYHQQPYVEYPISMADTSTHGSRDSSITGASSMTGASSISSLSTVSSDRRHQQGSHMQFPGGVTGEDGILRVYYDEDIIADIKSTLHASVGTRMIDDGKVLRVYHEGNLVAEIWRREDVSSPEMHQMHTVREVSQQERTLSPVSIPDIQHTRQAPQYQVPAMKTEIGRQNAFTSERIYENDDRQSVTESVSVGSDTEDEYFFEEYTVEHKLPLYEDLPATEFKPEDKVTNVFSYYKKKDQDEEVKPVKFQRSDSYIERMEKMRQEKEFKAHEAKQRMMRIQQIQPEIQTATVKQQDYSRPTSVTVTKPVTVHAPSQKPKLKPKPKSPPKFQHVKDSRTVYLKNRPLPEIPREPDEMSVCSTSSWQTEDTESTITGRAIDDDTAEKYRQMYSLYLQQHHHKREEEEQRRVAAPTKTPPVPPPRKHKKIPPMEAYIEQKENVPISGAEAMMKDALRKIDDMYASLTRKKTLPKYARKKPVPQQPVQVDTRRTELIEEVKRHLNAIRSQTNRPMTPEYKAEITREIKRRIYESRLTDMRTSTESPGQRWLLQNKKTKDFDEVSEADSTSSWCTVASGSTVASQVAPFGEVTVIVEPNRGTDPRRSRRKVTEASYHLHQAHSSDDDHTERQYVRRTFPRQQVRRQELQPVQEYEDPRILQEMYRRQQLLDNYHRQEQFQRNTERRQNYHTISSHATHYQQQHAESPYDMPQIEDRPPSPDPVYIEHVELQEIARHTVDGQVREESPSPEPVYVEHVELQEFARHNMADQTGTLSNVRDNRTSWGGQPSVKMIGTSGKSGSMPVLDDDLYDNMLKMLSGVTKQQEDPQVYDNLPGHEGQAASPLSMSPSHEQDETTRQKTEQYLQSAYKFINEGTYDFLQDPDATPKVQHRTQSYDALDTADDGHSMRKEVQQRRRTVSQSEVSEQETLPIRGGAIHRQAAMNEQGGRYGNESTSTHGSFSQGSRSTAQTRASYQSANQGRSLSQDRLLQSGTATVPNRRIDYQVRSSSLPPGITSEQMKAEGSNQVQKRSFQTSSQSMTLPQRGFQQSDVVVHHDAEPRHQTSSLIHKSSQQRSSQASSEQRKAYQQSSARGSKSLTRPTVPPPPPKLSTIQQNLPLDSGNQQQQFKRTSRQQQFQLSRNEANQQRVNERQMSAPPEGQRFYQQAEDQSSQARSSSVDRLQQQQQQRFSNGTQQQQRFSTGAQQQQQQQRVSTGVQQQQQRVSTGAQQQRFSSGTQQQQRFSTGEQQHQQQQRFSTGASGTGHGAMHMRYERPHSAQESYKGSMVSGQQSMRSRTASAGSSHSLPPSQRASTDRLVIERPDDLATRERSSSTSSCASSIPQVDLDALDLMLIEIGAEHHITPEVSAEEDDGTYATIPAQTVSDRQTTFSAYHKSDKCAGVPLFPVTDVPPELKLQTHPRFQKKDKDEMLLRLEEVRQKAKTEKHSQDEVRLAYRSELKRFIKGKEVVEDIYATPILKSKRPKVEISHKVQSKQEHKGDERSKPQITEKGPQPTHYQPLNIKIHPKITQTSDSLKKRSLTMEELYPHEERQRRQIIHKPTISQIHDHRKKMKPVLEAIKNTNATKSLQNALNQMQQQEQIQSQFDKAAKFTEMYSKSSKSHSHKSSEHKRLAKHRTSIEIDTSNNETRQRSSAHDFRKEESFDPTSVALFIDDDDDGDYAQLRSGATIDSYRHSDQSDQMTRRHGEQSSVPLVRVTPPTPSVPEPGRTTRSQPWAAMRTSTSLQSKGQHQAPLDTQLAAITEESSVSDSSLDCGKNEQKTKRKPLNECHYDNTLNMQWSKPHQQTSMLPSNVQHLSTSFRGDRQQAVSESNTQQTYQSSVIGSDSGKSVQSVLNVDIVPFPQQNVGQGVDKSHPDSVNDIVSDMEDYYTTRANEGLGPSLVPSTFTHAGNSDGECVAVSSVQSVSHLPMACLKPSDDTTNITTESSEDSSSEIYMWCPPGARQGIVIKGFIREQICYKYFDACVEQDLIDSSVELDGTLIDMHPVMACRNSRSFVTPQRLRLSRHIPGLPSQHFVPKPQIEVVIDVIEIEGLEVVYVFEGNVSASVCKASQNDFEAIALDRNSLGMVESVIDNNNTDSINDESMDYQSVESKPIVDGNDDSGLDTETSLESEVQKDIDVSVDFCSSDSKATECVLIAEELKDSDLDTETSNESEIQKDIDVSVCSTVSKAIEKTVVLQEIKKHDITEEVELKPASDTAETVPKLSETSTISQSERMQSPPPTPKSDHNVSEESDVQKMGISEHVTKDRIETLSPEEEHSDTQSAEETKVSLYSYSSESAISEMFSEDEHQMSSSKSDSDSEFSDCMFRRIPILPQIQGRSSSDPTLSDADRYYIDYMSHMRNQKRDGGRQRTSSDPQQINSEGAIGDVYCTSTSSSDADFPSVSDMYQRIMTLTRNIDATIADVINGSHTNDKEEEESGQSNTGSQVAVGVKEQSDETSSEPLDLDTTNVDLHDNDSVQEETDFIEMYVVGIIERAHAAASTEIELVDLGEGSSTDSGNSHQLDNSDDHEITETDVKMTSSPPIAVEECLEDAPEEDFGKAPISSKLDREDEQNKVQKPGTVTKTDAKMTSSPPIAVEECLEDPPEEDFGKSPISSKVDWEDKQDKVQEPETVTLPDSLPKAAMSLNESLEVQKEHCLPEHTDQRINEIIQDDSSSVLIEESMQSPEPLSEQIVLTSETVQEVSSKEDTCISDIIAAYGSQTVGNGMTDSTTPLPAPKSKDVKSSSDDESLISNLLDSYSLVSMEQNSQVVYSDSAQTKSPNIATESISSLERRDDRRDVTEYISMGTDSGKYQVLTDKYQEYLDRGLELIHTDDIDEPLSLSNVSEVSDTASESSSSTSSTKSASSWGSQETVIENPAFSVQYVKGVALQKLDMDTFQSKPERNINVPPRPAVQTSTKAYHMVKTDVDTKKHSTSCCSITLDNSRLQLDNRKGGKDEHAETNPEEKAHNDSGLSEHIGDEVNINKVDVKDAKDDTELRGDHGTDSILSDLEINQSEEQGSDILKGEMCEENRDDNKSNTGSLPEESLHIAIEGRDLGTEMTDNPDEDARIKESMKESPSDAVCDETQLEESSSDDGIKHIYCHDEAESCMKDETEVEGNFSSVNENVDSLSTHSQSDSPVLQHIVQGPDFDSSELKSSSKAEVVYTKEGNISIDDSKVVLTEDEKTKVSEQTELTTSEVLGERVMVDITNQTDMAVVEELLEEMVTVTVDLVEGNHGNIAEETEAENASLPGVMEVHELSSKEIVMGQTEKEDELPESENFKSCLDFCPESEREISSAIKDVENIINSESIETLATECEMRTVTEPTGLPTSLVDRVTHDNVFDDSLEDIASLSDVAVVEDLLAEMVAETVNAVDGKPGNITGETEEAIGNYVHEDSEMQCVAPELCPELCPGPTEMVQSSDAQPSLECITLEGEVMQIPETDTGESSIDQTETDKNIFDSSDIVSSSDSHAAQTVISLTKEDKINVISSEYSKSKITEQTTLSRSKFAFDRVTKDNSLDNREEDREVTLSEVDNVSQTDLGLVADLLREMVTETVDSVEGKHGNIPSKFDDDQSHLDPVSEKQSVADELCLENICEAGTNDIIQSSASLEDSVTQSADIHLDVFATDGVSLWDNSQKVKSNSRVDSQELYIEEETLSLSVESSGTSQTVRTDSVESSSNKRPLSDLILFSDSDHGSTNSLMLFSDSQPERRGRGVKHTFLMQYSDSSDQDSIDLKHPPGMRLERSESSGDEVGSLRPFLTHISKIDRTSPSQGAPHSGEASVSSTSHSESRKREVGALARDQTEMFDKLKTMTQGFDDILGQAKRMKDDFVSTRQQVSADLPQPGEANPEPSEIKTTTMSKRVQHPDHSTDHPSSTEEGIAPASDTAKSQGCALEGAVGAGSVHRLREPLPVAGRNRSLSLPVPELEETNSGDNTDAEDSDEPSDRSSNQPLSPREKRRNRTRQPLSANNSPSTHRHKAIKRRFWRR